MRIFGNKKSLKILFVATEAAPYAKVGGLGSVMESLPKALVEMGYDARIIMPKYLSIQEKYPNLQTEYEGLKVPTGNHSGPEILNCNIKKNDDEESGVSTYFLENEEYYEQRANVYGYADDTIRWALLCRGTLEFLKVSKKWVPDVIVSCDWQTALIPNYIKTVFAKDPVISKIASVLSIHNLYFQATYDHRYVSEMDYDDGHSEIPGFFNERMSKINWMRRGIMYADVINTVSPNYAREIMTKDYGELLDELLRERKAVVTGIMNGVDYDYWDPETDPYIFKNYSRHSVIDREKNKKSLQERFNLPVKEDAFVISYAGRLAKQKGLDLFFPIIHTLLQELPIQMVIVGEGESDIMGFFHDLETRFPDKVATHLKFDQILPHVVFGGSDVVIIPSRFEPCGLIQLEAMRMGTVPIVRKTGGLADSVEDYNPDKGTGTGFVFEKFDSSSLMIALIRAYENFKDKTKWRKLQERVMSKDFSWESSAKKYADLFDVAIKTKNLK